jgi:LAO/AO transport system kinase
MSTRTRKRDPKELLAAARDGDRGALARLISFVEEGGDLAREVGGLTFPKAGNAYTVGITGPTGSGKSTLTERLISTIRSTGDDVGVLAVDPSSPFSGGAFLGDRVRMQSHATDEGVFIRSMATRGHLGGLALATPEAIRVLDAGGIPWVLVETVGVGQVEIEIASSADTTVVVVPPGSGDAMQAAKAGLLEAADVFVVNKADRPGAAETRRDLEFMLHLSSADEGWTPPIVSTVASSGEGIDDFWKAINDHRAFLSEHGLLEKRRAHRLADELRHVVSQRVEQQAYERCQGPDFDRLLHEVVERRLDPYAAAGRLLDTDQG